MQLKYVQFNHMYVKSIFLLPIVLLALSCEKNEQPVLYGKWIWASTSGGIGGWYWEAEPNDRSNFLIISDVQIDTYIEDTLSYSREYILIEEAEDDPKLATGSYFQYFSLGRDSLIIWDPGNDGFNSVYVRD